MTTRGDGRSWGAKRKRREGDGSVGMGDRPTGGDGDAGFFIVTESGWLIKAAMDIHWSEGIKEGGRTLRPPQASDPSSAGDLPGISPTVV